MTTTIERFPVILRPDGWWIEPTEAECAERIGPYRTKAEAEVDRRGILRFLRRQAEGRNPFE